MSVTPASDTTEKLEELISDRRSHYLWSTGIFILLLILMVVCIVVALVFVKKEGSTQLNTLLGAVPPLIGSPTFGGNMTRSGRQLRAMRRWQRRIAQLKPDEPEAVRIRSHVDQLYALMDEDLWK